MPLGVLCSCWWFGIVYNILSANGFESPGMFCPCEGLLVLLGMEVCAPAFSLCACCPLFYCGLFLIFFFFLQLLFAERAK